MRQALELALEAFEWNYNTDLDNIPACEKWAKMLKEAITAIKEALAQPDQYAKGYADAMNWKVQNHLEHLPTAQPEQEPVLQNIEQYRLQMAGISTAAIGYWKEGDGIHPDYDTLALRDVAKLYAKYDALYKAQPKQKPVAWKLVPIEPTREMLEAMDECSIEGYDEHLYAGHAASVYMAAVDVAPTPPQRKPLTEGQLFKLWEEDTSCDMPDTFKQFKHTARAIEAAHGIKE